jgi:5-methylcytosine-specific restriction endonuclease McrA
VVALKSYVAMARSPAFTRYNIYLRDTFSCQYCGRAAGGARLDVVARHQGDAVEEQGRERILPRPQRVRDTFSCQYCGLRLPSGGLTFDHVVPRSRGGLSSRASTS